MSNQKGSRVTRCSHLFGAGRPALLLLVLIFSLSELSACITKDVLPPSASEIAVSFSLSPPAALQSGSQISLMVNVVNDFSNQGVDWVASCSAANCGSFNPTHTASGVATVYTAPSSVPPTSVNLTAKATASPSESVTVTVGIFSSISVTLTGFPASPLAAGSTTQVTAKVTGDANNLGVNWTLLCPSSGCGLITQQTASGAPATYTAPSVVTSSLNVTITATSVADPTQTVTTSVTVTPTASLSIAFAAGAGAPPSTMITSATASLVANVSSDPLNLGVDWIVTCSNGANGCGTFSPGSPAHTASGAAIVYTAPAIVPTGGLTVSITASSTANPAAFVTAMITINRPVIAISSISGIPTSLPVGGKATLSATVTNDPASGGGVDWAVTCTAAPGSSCGTFSSGLSTDHTASGVSTTYTAPSVIPLGSPAGNVTIMATSHANPASLSTAIIPITPSTAISINFASGADAPPLNLTTSATANIAAVITNDSLTPPNGVNWSVTCGSTGTGACGSFSVANTASNAPVVYTAPAAVPTGNTVTITAASAANPSSSVSATVTISNPVITVTITQAVSPLAAGSAETIIASVVNDSLKDGVSWTVSCTNSIVGAGCGTFNPLTSSGNTPQTSYTAPANVPSGGISVTITATSIANGITTGTAVVSIEPNPNLGFLNGPYALSLSGNNAAGFFAIVGSVTADGQGNITSGEEDINAALPVCSPSAATSPVTGSYSIGSDGRGTMTLQTGNTSCFGESGVQTLSFVVVGVPGTSVVRALVIEFDNTNASGSLDLQTLSGVTVSGSYAFTMSGIDLFPTSLSGAIAADMGGVFVASGGTISSGFQDENDQGTNTVTTKKSIAGTYTPPDSAGCGTMTFGLTNSQFTYAYCIVNAGEIKLLSWDITDDLVVAGSAFTQGTGTFSTQNTFTLSGTDGNQNTSLVSGGIFGASGTTLNAGVIDVNDNGPQVTNNSLLGSFSALSSGRGTLTLTLNTPPTVLTGFGSFAYYPTLNNGVLLLDLDADFASVGVAYPQITGINAGTFSGNYAMNLTGVVVGSPEEDAGGQVTSDGISLLSGTADVNGGTASDAGGILLTGGFTSNANGRFTGHLNLDLTSTDTQSFQEIFYILDNNTVLFIENDANGQTSGIMQSQNLTLP
jgi:hypothetical protein